MAEDKSDKGFSVVDRRVSADGDPEADDSAAADRAGEGRTANDGQGTEEKTGAESGSVREGASAPGAGGDEPEGPEARVPPMKVTLPTFILSLDDQAGFVQTFYSHFPALAVAQQTIPVI